MTKEHFGEVVTTFVNNGSPTTTDITPETMDDSVAIGFNRCGSIVVEASYPGFCDKKYKILLSVT